MAQFTIYRSTDASAPTLSGTVGSLVALLDACLVNGYGAKTAAGWVKSFSGTNKAAYRQGSGSNEFYLRVQDDGPGLGTAKEARITGYEAMTTVDAGTGPFPNTTLGVASTAMFVARKSATADATARAWIVVADARTVYVRVLAGDAASMYCGFSFGEFYSLVNSDGFRCFIQGRPTENSGTSSVDRSGAITTGVTTSLTGTCLARGHSGLGGPVAPAFSGDSAKGSSLGTITLGSIPFTNPSDGGLYLSQLWISDPTTAPIYGIRGRLRGLWHFLHPYASVADGDTVTGVGSLSGRTFLFLKAVTDQTGNQGIMTVETSDTLETN